MFSMKIIFRFPRSILLQTFADEVGVEVTAVDRRDLHDRHVLGRDRIGVVARGGVAVENRDADFVLHLLDQPSDQSRFARTDRTHEVNRGDAMFIEQRAIFLRQFCVRLEQAVLELDVVDFVGLTLR